MLTLGNRQNNNYKFKALLLLVCTFERYSFSSLQKNYIFWRLPLRIPLGEVCTRRSQTWNLANSVCSAICYTQNLQCFARFLKPRAAARAVFLISFAYQTVANRRLDLVWLCPDRLAIQFIRYYVEQIDYVFLLGDLGKSSSISNSLIGD